MSGARRTGEPTAQRVTMKLVAERAGVHVSTVSRALSRTGDTVPGVGPEVVRRIRAIADELGYRPDSNAASLRTRRTRVIGVLVPRLSDVVLATIFDGIDEAVAAHGYQAVVANTGDRPEERRRRLDLLLGRRVDGLIVADARLPATGPDAPETPVPDDIPVPLVLVNRRASGFLSVSCDDEHGGRLVGEHLLATGHRDIAIAGGHDWASTAVDRARGCRTALSEHGVHVPDDNVLYTGFGVDGGRRAVEALFGRSSHPSAIFAVNDYTAIGVMGALRDRGLAPGRDVAVVGYNDIDLARELPIPLSSVDTHARAMGRTAAEVLLARIERQPVRSVALQPHLRVRASCCG